MNCKKCGKELTGKQTSYCSVYCSKLHLKSLYRKRNRSKINEYNRLNKSLGVRGNGVELIARFKHLQVGKCFICGINEDLHVHHIRPRKFGGKNKVNNLMLLCRKCHFYFEEATRHFWRQTFRVETE